MVTQLLHRQKALTQTLLLFRKHNALYITQKQSDGSIPHACKGKASASTTILHCPNFQALSPRILQKIGELFALYRILHI